MHEFPCEGKVSEMREGDLCRGSQLRTTGRLFLVPSTFVPATVIAESNKRFEILMYAAMLLIGVGLIVYLAMTGKLKPKAGAPAVPPAVEAGADMS